METLVLPKRYEVLERAAKQSAVALSSIIRPVPESAEHIDQLLRELEIGHVGKLELICGKAGSGKTTFVKSLSLFYKNVSVNIFGVDTPLIDLATWIESREHVSKDFREIYLLTDRDNPAETDEQVRSSLERLRRAFRTARGDVLVLWPITDNKKAQAISNLAWEIGRDSLVRPQTKGIMPFAGIGKEQYWDTADLTARSLNSEGLESYGLAKPEVTSEIAAAETIGEFYSRIEAKAAEKIQSYAKVLQGKLLPRVWILLPGDDSVEIERTVRTLTQGTQNRIDADRICEYLDDESNKSAYLSEWRTRRKNAIFLLRQLDVRLFELSPNASLAAIRCYGNDSLRERLTKRTESESNAVESIRKMRFYQSLQKRQKSVLLRPGLHLKIQRTSTTEYRRWRLIGTMS